MTKTSDSITQKPEYVYVARNPCGCVSGLVNDDRDKFTADSVAGFISDGRTVDRVAWDVYVNEVAREPTFFKCNHGQLRLV